MLKLRKKIANPMTVIAIFATLSETSAAVSLPFLDNENREIYIWFLISFPFYLLFLFFVTLNFNYRSLYAPSDFEKGKHFIKAMDNAERTENVETQVSSDKHTHKRSSAAHDPPGDIGLQTNLWVQHHVRLPTLLKDLHIIDARGMNKKIDYRTLLEKVRQSKGEAAQVIVFLTAAESEKLLKECVFKYSRNTRKRSSSTFCVAYNVSSHDVTVIDQARQPDIQQSAALQAQ